MNRTTLALGLLLAASAALADPTVSVTRVAPRYPWNGVVDIDYTIDGLTGDTEDYFVELALDGEVMSNYVDYAACDLPLANGSNRVAWNATRAGYARVVSDAKVAARLVKRVLTATDARYLIVDLSAGKNAASYPARPVADCDSEEFNKDVYKTDRLVLKRVDSGDFWMGKGGYNSSGKYNATLNGDVTYPGDRNRVRLTKDFYLGIFEFTQGQYLNVTGSNPSSFKSASGGSDKVPRGDDLRRPVESLDFATPENTDGVLERLTNRVRVRTVKLGTFAYPTEAQWEYAARAGTTTRLPFGDHATASRTMQLNAVIGSGADWYRDKNGNVCTMTSAVGMRLPNQWGFYDMFGNVSEFIRDWYVSPYSKMGGDGVEHAATEEDPVVDPYMPETDTHYRCIRGSGYRDSTDQYSLFSGARNSNAGANTYMGFRVSATIE